MLIPVGVLSYFLIAPSQGRIVYGVLAVAVLLFWVLFFMPTLCGYDLGYRGCLRQVYGKLNGCPQHGALKRDAMFAAIRMRNPGQLLRIKWQDGSAPKGTTFGSPTETPAERSNRRRGGYDVIMLVVATVGSIAGVLALFVS